MTQGATVDGDEHTTQIKITGLNTMEVTNPEGRVVVTNEGVCVLTMAADHARALNTALTAYYTKVDGDG